MMRIRQGNDFIFLWAIERDGQPEDLNNATNIRLHFKNFDCVGEVKSFQIVDGNVVRVEVSPEWASNLGAYRLILSYEFEDSSYSDGDQKCVIDVLAFNIVPKTSEADDITEMAKTTDIMIGLKGDKGDPFTYEDFTPEQIEDLKRPAVEAAESVLIVENQISINEQGRVQSENERETAETTRVSNENNRVTSEQERVDAESLRQVNTSTAIANAEEATENANNAKGWSPSIVFEEYNGKQIKKLIGYIGGTGAEPTDNVGQYYTENGFTNNKDLAVNFKGSSVEAMIQTRDSYNQIPEPRNPNTLYFISNQA